MSEHALFQRLRRKLATNHQKLVRGRGPRAGQWFVALDGEVRTINPEAYSRQLKVLHDYEYLADE